MEVNGVIVYLGCIIFLFLIGKFFIIPLKIIAKLIGNSILGGILIFLVNTIGNVYNFHIGLNIITAIIIGILGVPRSYFTYGIEDIHLVKKSNGNRFKIYCYFLIIDVIIGEERENRNV